MDNFTVTYLPVGVGTFHMETAADQFSRSVKLLKSLDEGVIVPEAPLLSVEALRDFLAPQKPDLVIFQNLTFANGAYMAELLRLYEEPVLLWTLREPAADGGRLKLNSLTGAYSAAHTLRNAGRPFAYCVGAPEEDEVVRAVRDTMAAACLKKRLRGLTAGAVGTPPQGFEFGKAEEKELEETFGVKLVNVAVEEMFAAAKSYTDDECEAYLAKTEAAVRGLSAVPEANRKGHARLYKAYEDWVRANGIGALASRCWPDCFTQFGTPVCTVLSLLNDEGAAAACEADLYGALSMWIGMQLSGSPVFFGDPVAIDEAENTLTFWHCGMAPCSMARKDTGAVIGVHPNRKIGPVMDFGCESFPEATVFRIGREPDGGYRFFIAEGEAPDKPKQYNGTSLVVRTKANVRSLVERSVADGFEPHYVVIRGSHAGALKALAAMYGFPVREYE